MLAQTAGIVTAFLIWPLVLASRFVYSIGHHREHVEPGEFRAWSFDELEEQ